MNMKTWAEKEIEIACARERKACKGDEFEYGVACYESALKAFKSLIEDYHSGYSINLTKNIIIRLIEGKPLTPIEDTFDVWNEVYVLSEKHYTEYQCSRMSSLFKKIYTDGSVTYHDVYRVNVTYADKPGIYWTNGFATGLIDEMFPITMPYMPTIKPYTIYAEDFLVDPANGDYDTTGYLWVVNPDGEKIEINRYFAEKDGELKEIDFEEYCERKSRRVDKTEE